MSASLEPSSSRSFTPLATLSLPSAHVLLPQACNPAMDLVVLLAPAAGSAAGAFKPTMKGKEKAVDMSGWRATKVVLWRMLGGQVWEVEVKGNVAALAWSVDGLILTLLVSSISSSSFNLEHRSVHTGEISRTVPVVVKSAIDEERENGDVELQWSDAGVPWTDPTDGTAQMIIASLPRVTPVEPPKPAIINPFAKAQPVSATHTKLATFPSLRSTTTSPPDLLRVRLPTGDVHLLMGCFPCTATTTPAHLRLARNGHSMYQYFNTLLQGLEAIEAAWRESYKQTMLWREELEECGKLQGMSVQDVHADLFRLLMTGRCREAVSEWLGNKLTGRMLAKWEQTFTSTFDIIQRVICESLTPAIERMIIVLSELRKWEKSQFHSKGLRLPPEEIQQSINMACGLAKLLECIRQDAEHEAMASASWISWLKYETAKAGSGGGDEPHPMSHDLKLTWAFMTNGFARSIFSTYFPDTSPRPTTDLLPSALLQQIPPVKAARGTDAILIDTISSLSGRAPAHVLSPQTEPEEGHSHDRSSMMLSSPATDARHADASELDLDAEDESHMLDSDDESAATVAKDVPEQPAEPARILQLEPWVWTNSLLKVTEALLRRAIPTGPSDGEPTNKWADGLSARWSDAAEDGAAQWGATIINDGQQVILFKTDSSVLLDLRGIACVSLRFFDEAELALLVDAADGRYLITTDYRAYEDSMRPIPAAAGVRYNDASTWASEDASTDLHIRRARFLSPKAATFSTESANKVGLAANGRKGRRVCCVLGDEGTELGVWDMNADEDEEEEEGLAEEAEEDMEM